MRTMFDKGICVESCIIARERFEPIRNCGENGERFVTNSWECSEDRWSTSKVIAHMPSVRIMQWKQIGQQKRAMEDRVEVLPEEVSHVQCVHSSVPRRRAQREPQKDVRQQHNQIHDSEGQFDCPRQASGHVLPFLSSRPLSCLQGVGMS
ncbi:hypothetical protein T09_11835 [Trichinella sp. T9]|nr:hypothetical protein T09_11835 [Trichinella sp. T9]